MVTLALLLDPVKTGQSFLPDEGPDYLTASDVNASYNKSSFPSMYTEYMWVDWMNLTSFASEFSYYQLYSDRLQNGQVVIDD